MSEAVAVREKAGAVIPANNMQDVLQLGEMFERSGMFGCTQQGQGAVLVLTCMAEKISPLAFKRKYHLVDNTPTMRADSMLAEFRQSGGKYTIREQSDIRAAALFVYGDNSREMELTMEQALVAGWPYAKDGKTIRKNWACTPYAMLWARLVSRAVRLLAPEIVAGCYTPEEVADFGAPAPVHAEPVPITPEAAAEVLAAQRKPQVPAIEVKAEPVKEQAPPPAPAAVMQAEPEQLNLEVAPIGKIAGKFWGELDVETLLVVLNSKRPEITAGHKARICESIAARDPKDVMPEQAEGLRAWLATQKGA